MRCPSCNHDNRPERRFCTECGAVLSAACPSCGAPTEAGEKFCGGCGERLPAETEAPGAPTPAPEPKAATASGERRQLTVLFCDLVGSTPLSQQLDAEEWRDLIAQYQQAAAGAVERFGGHVAQYLGDGLLIYFGWPTAREDDPERAVRAGLAVLDAMAALNATLAAGDGTRLAVRIGMHTGLVVIGAMGGGGKSEVLALGDTTNIAARVQGAAEPDTVVITAATQRLVAGMFVVEDRGPQMLKGVREPVTLYRVVQPSGVRSRLDVAAGHLTRFVGREVELATLVDRWERAQDGEGQSVLVIGEAGVGKSRLVCQLRARLAAVAYTWLESRASPYTEGTPFFSVIELVQHGLVFTREDTAAEKLGKLEHGLGAVGSALNEAVPLIAALLDLPLPETYPPLRLSPDVQRRKTMELLAAWTLALSEVQPLVLLMEDLHWSDPSSRELLGRLVAQSPTARVLVLATARPEFTPPWPAHSRLTTLQLARLTNPQAREMVAALGGSRLPAQTVDTLVARADGVPLYLEELTKAVIEPGVARGEQTVPATLADSLMARLDRLSTAKEVAQRAAVLGREFSYPLLAAVAGLEDAVLRQGLVRLVDAEIVFARGEPPNATYTFKHALVEEAAYGSLLKRTRQQLHGRVADVLMSQFSARATAAPEVVARHAEAAGRIDDAITYYERAGEQAQIRSAHAEAISYFRHAIALLVTLPESGERDLREATLQLTLSESLVPARGYTHPELEAAYDRARVLCEARGDVDRLGRARIGLATVYHNCGQIECARALAARVLADAEQGGYLELQLGAHLALGTTDYYQGKFASSLAHREAARPLYQRGRLRRDVDAHVAALSWDTLALCMLGWPDRALACAREALALARGLDNPFSMAFALFFGTVVQWQRRDLAGQREWAAETIAVCEAQGFPQLLGFGRAYHAAARVAAGEPEAVADVLAAFALAAGTGSQSGAPAMFLLLGQVYLGAAQFAEARGAVETGLAISAQMGQPFCDADLHRLQGEILLATSGPSAEAEAAFNRALDIARAQEAKSPELRAATSLARLWRDQGKGAEARDLLLPVYAWFTEGFDTRDLIEAKVLLAELR